MSSDFEFPPYNPELREVVRQLVEEVGAESLVWGSDMPACERTVTYKQSLILFQTQCDFLSDDEPRCYSRREPRTPVSGRLGQNTVVSHLTTSNVIR